MNYQKQDAFRGAGEQILLPSDRLMQALMLLYLMICSNFIFDYKEYNIKSQIQLQLGTITVVCCLLSDSFCFPINQISSQSRNVKLKATTAWCEAFKILINQHFKKYSFLKFCYSFFTLFEYLFYCSQMTSFLTQFSKDVNEVYVFYHLFSSYVIPFYYRLCTHLPEQKHQQSQNQDACENGHQDDPPGNSGVLSHGTLWGHCHFHLQWNATGRWTKISGELGPR